ncbi:MAG: LTA synthase family protein [Verrucomicrobia bacterium]|nr:LTA synthase family protein [Verrucomicrobiota bacterium]
MPPVPRLIRWIVSLAVFFLVVMTLLRVGAYFAFTHDRLPLSQTWAGFWLGFRFDGRIVASAMLPLLVLGGISFLDAFNAAFGRRFWLVLLGLFSGLLLVFYVSDFLHYRYLNQRLNASVLGYLEDTKISAGMVWQTYPVGRIGLGLLVALGGFMAVIVYLHRRAAAATVALRKPARVTWFVATLLVCLLGIFGRAGQYPLRWSDAFNLRNDALANLALNPVQSFLSSLEFRTSGCEVAKVREHYPLMSAYLGVTAPDPERLSFERRIAARDGVSLGQPNVVIVICESFSAYKSSMWGNPLDTTPFFNGLCQEGLFFDNCFTPHYGTARGVWATLTGIPDVEAVETASRNPALVDQHTIVNDFAGYEKFYFIGGSSSWANIRGLLTNNIKGLKLYEEDSYRSPRIDVWGISDKNLLLEANEVLARQTKPFFAVIQTADNHRPYTIPKEDLKEFTKVDVPAEKLKQCGFESLAEMNAFRYTDYCFRKFFEAARQSAYFANTIFVFVGDHGIDGNADSMFPPAWTEHKLTAFHVPLLFYGPKFVSPQRVHAVASMVDILPTLAGIVNIPYRNTAMGRDLLRRQQLDGGTGNAAFIIDRHDNWIGLVKQQHFGRHRLDGTRPEVVWADFNAPAPGGINAPRDDHRALANAFYETARYMLLNNKKADAEK